mgnify:CR=1 FL=1
MQKRLTRGYVQVYTGNGKGKSTAAFGLAVRAAGAGLRVFIAQFLKSGQYSEIRGLKALRGRVTVRQFGSGHFVKGKPAASDFRVAAKGVEAVRNVLLGHRADVVILDEINVAVRAGVVPLRAIWGLLAIRPPDVEIVLTGRNADRRIIERADLVTEMREIKHYYRAGIKARRGIEM